MRGFFYTRVGRPLLELLRQGVTPEKMALSLAWGAALGVFPVLGTSTLLCTLAAVALRLNLPAIQIVNYLVYPAQIALIIPFFRMGERLFGARQLVLSPPQVYGLIHANPWRAVSVLWTTTWHAIVVWSLAAPVLMAMVYVALAWLLRRVMPAGENSQSTVESSTGMKEKSVSGQQSGRNGA